MVLAAKHQERWRGVLSTVSFSRPVADYSVCIPPTRSFHSIDHLTGTLKPQTNRPYGDWYTGRWWVGCYGTFGTARARRGLGGLSRPRCTKCNSSPIVSEMTYNVSRGTLNSTIPYHTITRQRPVYQLHYRAVLCKHGLCRHAVSVRLCVCVCLCLSRSWFLSKRINLSSIFSPVGSHTILVFSYQISWQYADGNPPPTAALNASGVGRNRDSEWISIFAMGYCCTVVSLSHLAAGFLLTAGVRVSDDQGPRAISSRGRPWLCTARDRPSVESVNRV